MTFLLDNEKYSDFDIGDQRDMANDVRILADVFYNDDGSRNEIEDMEDLDEEDDVDMFYSDDLVKRDDIEGANKFELSNDEIDDVGKARKFDNTVEQFEDEDEFEDEADVGDMADAYQLVRRRAFERLSDNV